MLEHPGPFTYEVRRGGFTLADIWSIPEEMAAFCEGATFDPASHLNAAIHRWKHPLSHEGFLLMDLIDVLGQSNSKKGQWKRWPRPIKHQGGKNVERLGKSSMSPSQSRRALLRNAGRGI